MVNLNFLSVGCRRSQGQERDDSAGDSLRTKKSVVGRNSQSECQYNFIMCVVAFPSWRGFNNLGSSWVDANFARMIKMGHRIISDTVSFTCGTDEILRLPQVNPIITIKIHCPRVAITGERNKHYGDSLSRLCR